MADTPQLKSKEQIYGQLVDSVLSRSEIITDLNRGSIMDSLLLGMAELGFTMTADMIQMITSLAIDRSSGEILRRIAADEDVPLFSATEATGRVRITDLSFTKIEDKVFPGLPAPVAGSTSIYIIDGSRFPATGSVYIGRGTNSVEGPLAYTAVTPIPSLANPDYWEITLSTPTTKFHNLSESVILAQGGNRTVPVGTNLQTRQGVSAEAIQFTTTQPATILDGEVEVTSVPVIASQPGTQGNVSRGSIVEVLGLAFPASSFNDDPLTNAVPDDTDESIRDRIKAYRQSRAKGTAVAIRTAAVGVESPEERKRVVSSNIKRQPIAEQILVIDDGTGYQPIDAGVGLENVFDEALGGEVDFQLENPMVVKASVVTLAQQPFDIQGGQTLAVEMTGQSVPVHTFQADDFRVFRAATAYEVAGSINADTQNLPYYARVVDGGTRVQIISKERNEIRVDDSSTANAGLKLPTNRVFSLRLYKNDVAMSQDGLDAAVETADQPDWSNILPGDTIDYVVDDTTPQSIAITNAMFQKYGPTLTVNRSQPIDIWAKVLNDVMPGVEVTVINQALRFRSRSGKLDTASISLDRTVGIGAAMFPSSASITEASGLSSDYILNLKTGQGLLAEPLQPGDRVTAGSRFTRAKIETQAFTGSSLSLGTLGKMFAMVDGSGEFVPMSVNLTVGITFELASAASAWVSLNPYIAGDFVTFGGQYYQAIEDVTSSTNPSLDQANWCLASEWEVAVRAEGATPSDDAFPNSLVGDWLVFWQDAADPVLGAFSAANQGTWRIRRRPSGQCVTIVNPSAVAETKSPADVSRLTSVRGSAPVQYGEFDITGPNAVDTIEKLRDAFNSKFNGLQAVIVNGRVRVESKTLDDAVSEIFVVVLSDSMRNTLSLEAGAFRAVPSHNGFISTDPELGKGMPTFKILQIDDSANITDSTFESSEYMSRYDGNRNDLVEFIAPATGSEAEGADSATNRGTAIQVRDFNEGTGVLSFKDKPVALTDAQVDNQLIPTKTKAEGDLFWLRQGLVLDANDALSFIVDQDSEAKSFLAKASRRIQLTTSVPPSQFSATDDETSLSLNHPSTFRDFDFRDFKVWIQSRGLIQGLAFKSVEFGPAGERNGITFRYPEVGDAAIGHTWLQGVVSALAINLASGPERALGAGDAWDAETGWTVSAPVVSGNIETVTYSHTPGVGQTPNLLGAGGPLALDVVSILSGSGFTPENKGKFKVTAVTATTFDAQGPVGTFVQDEIQNFTIEYPDAVSITAPAGTGTATITTREPHRVTQGFKVGIYGANPVDYVGAFLVVQVLDAYRFRIEVPAVDSDSVATVERVVVADQVTTTIEVSSSLGAIAPGDPVRVSAVAVNPDYNGDFIASVGTGGTTLVIDFTAPAYAAHTPVGVTAYSRVDGIVTLTAAAHGRASGDWIEVSSVASGLNGFFQVLDAPTVNSLRYISVGANTSGGAGGTVAEAFGPGSYVFNAGQVLYTPTATNAVPPAAPWTVVNGAATTATSGRVDAIADTVGGISRILQAEDNLRFFPITSTRQDVQDYVDSALSEHYTAVAQAPTTDPMDASTQANSGPSYVGSGNVVIEPIFGSYDRWINFPSVVPAAKAADIYFELAASGDPLRADINELTLRASRSDDSTGVTRIRVTTSRLALPTETALTIAADWIITQDVTGLGSAESYVKTYTQNTSPAPSDFVLKNPLPDMESGDQAYLIATTIEQYSRLMARLANSGLSNVAEVGTSQSLTGLQVKTNTFGLEGSVQLSGGNANTSAAAVMGSGAVRNGQPGVDVLLDLRRPFPPAGFIRLRNTVAQNKAVAIDSSTSIQITPNFPTGGTSTITETMGDPIFRTVRIPTSSFAAAAFRLDRQGRFACLRQISGTSLQITQLVQEGDWVVLSGPTFVGGNAGIFQVVRTFGDALWFENELAEDVIIEAPAADAINIFSYDSVMPGDRIAIGGDILSQDNVGIYTVTDDVLLMSPTSVIVSGVLSAVGPVVLGVQSGNLSVTEAAPLSLIKQVVSSSVSANNPEFAFLGLDSPSLLTRITPSLAAVAEAMSKVGSSEDIRTGLDAYRYYQGLLRSTYDTVYGDPTNPSKQGVAAAGADIDIQAPVIRRILADLTIRLKTGVPFTEVIDSVKAAVGGYVNSRGVGQQVSISQISAAVQRIEGVVAVVTISTSPLPSTGLINVQPNETPKILNPTSDVTVTIVNT